MKMKLRDRRVGLLVLTVMVFVSLAAAQTPLRPLVMRSNETRGVPPAECAEGLTDAPPPPRIAVSEIPLPEPAPADVPPPPSATLRGDLEAVQNALVRNDRPAFDESLARTRTLVESYPAGGERTAAEKALRVYGDIARLWDAQYVSPFFGEDSPEYAALSAYPGYAEAVRRSTFTDARGTRFYPAAESRQFLSTIAAQRLQRLGIRTTTPPARATRTERPSTTTGSLTPAPSTRSAPRSTPRVTSTTPRRGTSSGTTTRPRTTTRSTTRESRSTAPSTRKPAAATLTPSKPNPSAPPTTAADPAPATTAPSSSPAAGDVTPSSDVPPANADAPTSTTPASTPTWTDTTPTDRPSATTIPDTETALDTAADTAFSTPTSDTATTTAPSGTPPAPKRPVVLATILILIGLGVLIVLFRASR